LSRTEASNIPEQVRYTVPRGGGRYGILDPEGHGALSLWVPPAFGLWHGECSRWVCSQLRDLTTERKT